MKTVSLFAFLLFLAVLAFSSASACDDGSSSNYDTKCFKNHYSREGMARLEPVKAANLGSFNCSGTQIVFNPSTGEYVAHYNFGWFPLSTLYEEGCGCWVTTTTVPGSAPFRIYEYGNGRRGPFEDGTCMPFEFPEANGKVTSTTAFSRNINYVHRDLPYLNTADSTLAAHQTYYRVHNSTNELVVLRKFNSAGYIEWMQNLNCYLVQPQL
nr:hypothetical protein pmam_493 [Pithovirus mammoth]